jgi:enoyl-CoA hydratase/carnithine racemase
MADDPVLYDQHGGVAVLTLNRPERLNAWTGDLERRYLDLLDQCAADGAVKVIVVTGAGRGFCAGADMDLLQGIQTAGGQGPNLGAARPSWHATTLPKPVIGAINGACAGIGLVHALMLDVRIAAAGAKFTTAFSRRGLVAEYGISWVLPKLVGPARALDLLMSGRVFLAEEAYELGLVNKVVPGDELMDEVLAYAHELATHASPTSMAAMKQQVWGDFGRSLPEATEYAKTLMAESLRAPDFKEGVSSYLEKRAPSFGPIQGWATKA